METTYSEAIHDAIDRFGDDAVVKTNADDQNILDHLNDIDYRNDPITWVREDNNKSDFDEFSYTTWTIYEVRDGFVVNSEPMARVLSSEDYMLLYGPENDA